MMSTDVNSENMHVLDMRARAKGSATTDKTKTSGLSTGLALRNMNINQRSASQTQKSKPQVESKAIDDDEIETMPENLASEPDDYSDILPLKERLTPEVLKQILFAPIESSDPSEDDTHKGARQLEINFSYDLEEYDQDLVAEEVTEHFPPCSLDDVTPLDDWW